MFFQINPNSKAYNEGVQVGDYVEAINGKKCQTLMHQEALQLIKDANSKLKLELKRWVLNISSYNTKDWALAVLRVVGFQSAWPKEKSHF